MVYALARSRRTGLRIFDFVCAWFDEQQYYQFYPLRGPLEYLDRS
jgi:hypothetical protein